MEAVILCEAKFGAGPVQAAIDYLAVEKRYRIVGAAVVSRAVPAGFRLEVPVIAAPDAVAAVREAAASFRPRVIIDVTESSLEGRFEWANEALRLGMEVHGADFRLWPPAFKHAAAIPTVSFVGVGSGVGKSAAIIELLRELKSQSRAAALVLDLGGPSYPELVEGLSPEAVAVRLLGYHRDGRRIDGDHYLIAAAAGVPAVGCSFAGTGLTGVPLASVMGDGAVLAAEAGGEFLAVEGSGQAVPPMAAGAVCQLVNIRTDPATLRQLPFAYQVRRADLVVATGFKAEPAENTLEDLRREVKELNPGVALHYAPLVPEWVAPPAATKAVVLSARAPGAAASLVRYWNARTKGGVREVISSQDPGARAAVLKALRAAGPRAALLLDMAVPALGEWLEIAAARKSEVCATYEALKPAKAIFGSLIRQARRAVV